MDAHLATISLIDVADLPSIDTSRDEMACGWCTRAKCYLEGGRGMKARTREHEKYFEKKSLPQVTSLNFDLSVHAPRFELGRFFLVNLL